MREITLAAISWLDKLLEGDTASSSLYNLVVLQCS